MVSTRGRKRPSEAFEELPEPKRPRKRILRPKLPSPGPTEITLADQGIFPFTRSRLNTGVCRSTRAALLSSSVSIRTDASTQTNEEIVILTRSELAALKERITTPKRTRDEFENSQEDEPIAKRQLFTPQSKPDNHLWMFGSMNSSMAARTAPVRGHVNRRLRGPITTSTFSPRPRQTSYERMPEAIKPIEPEAPASDPSEVRSHTADPAGDNHETETPDSKTERKSWFGSLGKIASMPFNMFSPRAASPDRNIKSAQPQSPNSTPIHHAGTDEDHEQEVAPLSEQPHSRKFRIRNVRAPRSEPRRPNPKYDHLHQITPGSAAYQKLITGEFTAPPRAPTPPDPTEQMKERHPEMSDSEIAAIVARRKRKAAMQEQKYGIEQEEDVPMHAPLFGPDSHYARGTVDTRMFTEKPYASIPAESKKRKHPEVNETASKSRTFGVELDVAEEDDENEDDEMAEEEAPETPLAKKQKTLPSTTPRSALRKNGNLGASFSRTPGRNVNFNENPISGSRNLRAHYGPAGQYKGSTFADERSPESFDETASTLRSSLQWQSPLTNSNTRINAGIKSRLETRIELEKNWAGSLPAVNFSVRDPNNPDWRPTAGNPAPGVFRVPDSDDDDESDTQDEESILGSINTTITPEQPSTPKMSHAELPNSGLPALHSSLNGDSVLTESTELALEKARSRAQKYQPKNSSRLSSVSQAMSRSPSPDSINENTEDAWSSRYHVTAPAVKPLGAPQQPFVEPDNTIRGEDGMTDYEREHQFDHWAANEIVWPEPQTYEEAGTGSKYIHDLIRKNWGREDDKRSEKFWSKEFDDMDRAQEAAKAQGTRLVFITGMEDAEEFMDV